jgi:hypothetical protein
MCALNETTGSAYLECSLAVTTAPLARAALRQLLSDEIDHARLGWAHLASPRLPFPIRAAVAPWIQPMMAANLRQWRDRASLTPSETLTAHGCPPWALVDAAVLGAMRDLIVPGFARFGYDMRPVAEWLTRQ